MSMPGPDAFVRVRNVRVASVAFNVSLEISRGELAAVIGPSGAERTLLLDLLAGFARPDAGEILLGGTDLTRLPPHRRGVAAGGADAALFPDMSVADNIAFPLSVRRMKRIARDEQVTKVARLFGLLRRLEARPAALTAAERHAAALARAASGVPPLIVLDDPLRGLDAGERAMLLGRLRAAQRQLGLTILYAAPDLGTLTLVADRVIVLAGGAVQQAGAPRDIYEHPERALVARLLGDNNLLPGVVEAVDEDAVATVMLGGLYPVQARVADCGGPGTPAVVAIRPERIAVAAVDAAEMGEGALPATLRAVVHAGDHVRLVLDVTDSKGLPLEIVVKRPVIAALAGFAPGASLAIAWQPDDAHAFSPET